MEMFLFKMLALHLTLAIQENAYMWFPSLITPKGFDCKIEELVAKRPK